jgi:hypothetical protein
MFSSSDWSRNTSKRSSTAVTSSMRSSESAPTSATEVSMSIGPAGSRISRTRSRKACSSGLSGGVTLMTHGTFLAFQYHPILWSRTWSIGRDMV